MATARDIIYRSLRLIHVLDSSETPTADEANDALDALNAMLDGWSVPGLYIYATKQEEVTWPASTQSRTIGSGGDFDTTRPTRILEGTFFQDSNSNDYIVEVLSTREAYNAIVDKSTSSSHPEYLYYEPTDPLGTLYIWPVPSSSISLFLNTPEQLDSIATLDTTFAFPPGYERAITYSLAVELAPEFGVGAPPEVVDISRKANRAIRRTNAPKPVSAVETGWIGGQRKYNVYGDR